MLVVFAQTIFTRAVEPVIPMIAGDLAVDVKTAALLSTVYAFPYALVQPVLGVTGDFFGKTRLMNACLLGIALSALVCAVATSFPLLVAMRIVAGLVAGGVFPIAMALIGDLVPVEQRQVAIARLLGVGLTGNVIGSTIAGVIGDLLGWRGVFAISRIVRAGRDDRRVLRATRRGRPEGEVRSRGGAGKFPQHLCRSARQGLL
jgi:predicted MFS family arabinose efflux permease